MILGESGFLGGRELLPLLVLALGGALLVGNVLALTRPPTAPGGEAARAPVARTLAMAGLGLVATVWALASLVAG